MIYTKPILSQVQFRLLKAEDLPRLEWGGKFRHFRRLYAMVYQQTLRGEALMWGADYAHAGLIGQLFVQLKAENSDWADGCHKAYIFGFRVFPQYQRQGVGSGMLDTAENDLRQRGFGQVTLNVARTNHDALRLYQRLQYQIISREAGDWSYLDHQGRQRFVHEPAFRMMKKL